MKGLDPEGGMHQDNVRKMLAFSPVYEETSFMAAWNMEPYDDFPEFSMQPAQDDTSEQEQQQQHHHYHPPPHPPPPNVAFHAYLPMLVLASRQEAEVAQVVEPLVSLRSAAVNNDHRGNNHYQDEDVMTDAKEESRPVVSFAMPQISSATFHTVDPSPDEESILSGSHFNSAASQLVPTYIELLGLYDQICSDFITETRRDIHQLIDVEIQPEFLQGEEPLAEASAMHWIESPPNDDVSPLDTTAMERILAQEYHKAMDKLRAEVPETWSSKHPEDALKQIKAWAWEHLDHPYPERVDLLELEEQTGLEAKKIKNWFVNYRKRHWNADLKRRKESGPSRRR